MKNLEEAKAICIDLLLIPFEGYAKKLPDGSCEAYPDPASKLVKIPLSERIKLTYPELVELGKPWTIGYGSTYDIDGTPIKPGEIWSREKAIDVKKKVLDKFLHNLLQMSPGLKDENPYKLAAVLSWVYNIGLGNYRISTYKKKIDAKDWEEAGRQGLLWNKAQGKVLRGLTFRRQAEQLCLLK
jgi:lysozyme